MVKSYIYLQDSLPIYSNKTMKYLAAVEKRPINMYLSIYYHLLNFLGGIKELSRPGFSIKT